jgi:MarR family transcriptional regulator, transcriptional regulator for hemolysin
MRKIPKKLTENVAYMLHHAALDYQVHFDAEMQALGLTRSQWLLLAHLHFCDGINQKALADLMEIGKGAAGKLAQKLEQAGWIRREADALDGRAFNLYIETAARPVVANLVELLVIETDHSLEGFSREEIDTLRGYLRRIRGNLAQNPLPKKWLQLKARTLAAQRAAGL